MNDKIQHFAFGLASMAASLLLYGSLPLWKATLPAAFLWVFLEMVQADAFGDGILWFFRKDTWTDLLADVLGGAVPLALFLLMRGMIP